MAEPILNTDPRIYGGNAPTGDAVPEFTPPGSADTSGKSYEAPERQPQSEISGGAMTAAVGQANIAQNARPIADYSQSVKAAAKSWTTTRIWDSIQMPNFDVDPDFDPKPYINAAPMSLSEDEHKFLAQSRSEQEYQYRLSRTTEQRDLYQQMGDHPLLSTVVSFADPVYFAIDLASMGVGRIASAVGAGRKLATATSFAAAAGATYGVGQVEQTQAAVSDADVIANALLNGAGAAMAYRLGKFHKADPAYPSDELGQAVAKMQGAGAGIERRIVAEGEDVAAIKPGRLQSEMEQEVLRNKEMLPGTITPREALFVNDITDAQLASRVKGNLDNSSDAFAFLSKWSDDASFGPIIKALQDEHGKLLSQLTVYDTKLAQDGRAFYQGNRHAVFMDSTSPKYFNAQVAVHEVIHGLTVHKLRYGLDNPGSAHGRIAAELESLRKDVKKMAKQTQLNEGERKLVDYFTKNPQEFVAGLFAGRNDPFVKLMAKMQAADGKTSILSQVVNAVRKLVGVKPSEMSAFTRALDLTDELINTPLDITRVGKEGRPTLSFAPPAGTSAQMAGTVISKQESLAARTGQKISWSLHKTLAGLGKEGRRVADTLVDDPINMTGDSAVSQRAAIRSDLASLQYQYEDALKEMMAESGAGLWQRITNPRKSAEIQHRIEKQVYAELQRREAASRLGLQWADSTVDPRITKMANAHDAATKQALREMKAAGVLGADAVEEMPGYTPRRWSVTQIEDLESRVAAALGASDKGARTVVRNWLGDAIRKANPAWDQDTSRDVAAALIDRARRKGYFEDSNFRGHVGNAGAKEVRDIMTQAGIPPDRIERAMDVITGVVDEAGKSSNLKHRIAIDTSHTMNVGDDVVSIMDLLDTNVSRNLENYLDGAAGNSALARKGLTTNTEVDALRTEFLKGIDNEAERQRAAELFDNTIAALRGLPTGDTLPDGMRKLQAVTQMVGLASSGLWQVTEYANAMAKYGLAKTFKEVMRGMPVFRSLMGDIAGSTGEAASLERILARNSAQDLRLRPYVQKMEDGFEMNLGDATLLSLTQAKQLVPYLNAMRWVHHHQAKTVGNLVADTFHRAATGDAKAAAALEKYGLEAPQLGSVKADIARYGLDTEKWSDATWAQVRGPLSKMMDDAVLKNRTGEIPAFAQFSNVGKFIFTFRSFVLGAHNKVLAGTLGREGFSGLGLLMLYQFPLTMAASAANSAMRGKPESDPNKLALQSLAQMGSMGLFSELWGVVSGEKQQFGASGLIAIDRIYKTGSALAQGNYGSATAAGISTIPLFGIIPGVRAFSETFKSD